MFLHPHHFQAADRYWAELVHTSEQWDHPYNYGLQDINCGFHGSQFRIDRLRARMRDGTLIARGGGDPPLVQSFIDAIRNDTVPAVTGEDGLRALEVTLCAYESARRHEPVACPDDLPG